MKKAAVLFLLLSLSINALASDLSFSAGGGGLVGYTFTRYTLEGGSVQSSQHMDRFDYAGFLFFDATYGELSIMIKGGNSTYSENMIYEVAAMGDSAGTGTEMSLGFSLLGKYPFAINEAMTWFPLFGIEYQIALIQRRQPEGGLVYNREEGRLVEDRDADNNPYSLSAWNSFWIQIGVGLDYNLTDSLFFRSELLFGFRLPTMYELGALEVVKNPPMNVQNPKLGGLTGHPALKIGIGYRF